MKVELEESIEKIRNKMISVGMLKGFTSAETIKLSKKLDSLINEHMKQNLSA